MGRFPGLWCSVALMIFIGTASIADDAASALRAQAEQALTSGDAAAAETIAQQLLTTHPDSYAGRFLLALALSDQGDNNGAARAAARAYRVAPTKADKLISARLAGNAHLKAEHFARSEIWLRRAANHIETEEEAKRVVLEFHRAQQANPLTLRFGGWVTPTNNINGGAENANFTYEGIPWDFTLPGYRRALSGTEFGAESQLGYRLYETDAHRTSFNGYFFGRSYRFSEEAQELAPEFSGDDFSTVIVDLSLRHDRHLFDQLGPTSGEYHLGRVWSGGELFWEYRTLALQQVFPLSEGDRLTLRAERRDQISPKVLVPEIHFESYSATINTTLPNDDGLQFGLNYDYSDGGFERVYEEYRGNVNYAPDGTLWNMGGVFTMEYGYRSYDEYSTTLDGRRDRFGSLGATIVFKDISYWGFSPSISVKGRRTVSSAEENTSNVVEGRFSLKSTF
ncbi:hypothetical protein ACJ5NV_19500 [Loktanella agnita]|uniref:hypothetical protein n=1 Tax=Loktanella agnita TaxID=287097 RepID=UPI00398929BF